jgi:hypothetical protein
MTSQSHNVSGLSVIATVPKCIKTKECKIENNTPLGMAEKFSFKADENIDECFVPIRNFKSNEPTGIGYKTQLEIVFADGKGTTSKCITVPNPRSDLTKEDIIEALIAGTEKDTRVFFGHIKIECDLYPWGYLRHYALDEESGAKLLTALSRLSNGNIIEDSMRYNDKKRDFKTGYYQAYRGYIFRFRNDGSKPKCRKFTLH